MRAAAGAAEGRRRRRRRSSEARGRAERGPARPAAVAAPVTRRRGRPARPLRPAGPRPSLPALGHGRLRVAAAGAEEEPARVGEPLSRRRRRGVRRLPRASRTAEAGARAGPLPTPGVRAPGVGLRRRRRRAMVRPTSRPRRGCGRAGERESGRRARRASPLVRGRWGGRFPWMPAGFLLLI